MKEITNNKTINIKSLNLHIHDYRIRPFRQCLQRENLNKYISDSIVSNWDREAFTDYKGATLFYRDVARRIAKLHILFEEAGMKPGDRIALCGKNSSNWGTACIAAISYGAVVVPILHEFKADNIHHIINHSETKLFFVGDQIWENLNENSMPDLKA